MCAHGRHGGSYLHAETTQDNAIGSLTVTLTKYITTLEKQQISDRT